MLSSFGTDTTKPLFAVVTLGMVYGHVICWQLIVALFASAGITRAGSNLMAKLPSEAESLLETKIGSSGITVYYLPRISFANSSVGSTFL